MPTGDIEVFATELKILNKSETPPIYIKDEYLSIPLTINNCLNNCGDCGNA